MLAGVKLYGPGGGTIGAAIQPVQPVVTVTLSCLAFKTEKWSLVKIIAIVLGITGSMILFGGDGSHAKSHHQ